MYLTIDVHFIRCRWCAVAFLSLDACYSHLNDGGCPVLEEKKRREAAEAQAEAARQQSQGRAVFGSPEENDDEDEEGEEEDEDYENPDDDDGEEDEEDEEEDQEIPEKSENLPVAAGEAVPEHECPMCAASFGDMFLLENHIIGEHNVTSTARVRFLIERASGKASTTEKKGPVDVLVKKNSHADPMDCYDSSVGMFR